VLADGGDYAAAERAFREAMTLRRDRLGDGHPEVDNAVSNLAGALAGRGELAEATRLMEGVVARKRRSMGASHPDLAIDMTRFADMLRAMEAHQRAEVLYREALDIQHRSSRGPTGATATTLLGLGRLALGRGDAAAAERLLRDAWAADRVGAANGYARNSEVPRALAASLAAQGRLAEAEPLLLESLSIARASRDREARIRAVVRDVVTLYERLGREGDAARYRALP
jgi:tetratricopeptide (TPR) repeat protein